MRRSGKSSKKANGTSSRGRPASQVPSKVEPFKVRAKNLGLKPRYSLDKPWELIEEIEGPDYK